METLDQKIIRSVSEKMLRKAAMHCSTKKFGSLSQKRRRRQRRTDSVEKFAQALSYRKRNLRSPGHEICGENRGITQAKALDIKAAMELENGIVDAETAGNVASPEDIVSFLAPELHAFDRECFKTVLLNTKNGLISVEDISVGTINALLVHAREVFRGANAKNAFSLILVHNHPSGDPTPSENDIRITEQLKNAGEFIGIRVIDHIIIGNETFYSFQNESILF
jgi:DNA repair protein RadC